MQQITLGQHAGSPGRQHADPKRGAGTAEAHHRIRMAAGGDRHPIADKITETQLPLLVARWGTRLVGPDPHLDEVNRLGWTRRIDPVGIVALSVHNARTCAHPLGQSGKDQPRVAMRVLMDQQAGKYPGDDLGVMMGMVRVTGSDAHPVVIVDHETTEGDVRRIVVLAEGKAVVGLGPISPGEETLPRPTDLDARDRDPRRAHWFSIAAL
jgi:hypothetical protein